MIYCLDHLIQAIKAKRKCAFVSYDSFPSSARRKKDKRPAFLAAALEWIAAIHNNNFLRKKYACRNEKTRLLLRHTQSEIFAPAHHTRLGSGAE